MRDDEHMGDGLSVDGHLFGRVLLGDAEIYDNRDDPTEASGRAVSPLARDVSER